MSSSSPDGVRFSTIKYVPLTLFDECDAGWHGPMKVSATKVCIVWEKDIHGELIIREVWTACDECVANKRISPDISIADNVRIVAQ